MSTGDPYRSSGGVPCPRCQDALAREDDGELSCGTGCGTWMDNKLLATLVPLEVIARSSGNPFRATPLPPTRCLVCRRALDDLYKGAVDVLTIGQCLAHGVWLEGAQRGTFEALFRSEIEAYASERAAPELPEPTLEERVAALEAKVAALERALANR